MTDHLTSAYAQAEALYDLDLPVLRRLTPGEYRALTLRARRWAGVLLDAGEIAEAKHQLNEAARFSALSPELRSSQEIVGLHPSFAAWMLGYPAEWDACAPTAMPSSRKSRPK
jgi:hypothetical protein